MPKRNVVKTGTAVLVIKNAHVLLAPAISLARQSQPAAAKKNVVLKEIAAYPEKNANVINVLANSNALVFVVVRQNNVATLATVANQAVSALAKLVSAANNVILKIVIANKIAVARRAAAARMETAVIQVKNVFAQTATVLANVVPKNAKKTVVRKIKAFNRQIVARAKNAVHKVIAVYQERNASAKTAPAQLSA